VKYKNMMRVILMILISLSVTSCREPSGNIDNKFGALKKTSDSIVDQNINSSVGKEPISIDSTWNELAFNKGGCLVGGQYIYDGRFSREGCVMSVTKPWISFLNRDSVELIAFLVEKIKANSPETKIHTCPFFEANEAELAVYSLQRVYKTNWYDLPGFSEYQTKVGSGSSDNHQVWLQNIINTEEDRERLIQSWGGG
jgi:hypothetical protein